MAFFLFMLAACHSTEDGGERTEDRKPDAENASIIENVPEPQEPEPPPDPMEEYINACLNELSLEEKIGQMFICAFRDTAQGVTEINGAMREALGSYHLGGVILFTENLRDKEQTKKLITNLQSASAIPLFIAMDEEGGIVSRLSALGYDKLPSASRIGSSGDNAQAFEQGRTIAANLKGLGINVDFAPVADINSNKQNTVIGSRAFSDDPEIAGEMVREFVKGLQGEGIIATLKHFPGHGDTKEDTHYGWASVTHDLARLTEQELVPFKMGIEAGAGFIMVGHISVPNVTGNDKAATFSQEIVTAILREQLGYSGVIITDALDMGAVVKYYEPAETAVQAVLAGVDILLMPQDVSLAFNGILKAVEDGEISESRIDESLSRILRTKALFGIVDTQGGFGR
jgi:beta-N-acetylhexosaminidase